MRIICPCAPCCFIVLYLSFIVCACWHFPLVFTQSHCQHLTLETNERPPVCLLLSVSPTLYTFKIFLALPFLWLSVTRTYESRHLSVLWLGEAVEGAGQAATLISNPFRICFATSAVYTLRAHGVKRLFVSMWVCICLVWGERCVCVCV